MTKTSIHAFRVWDSGEQQYMEQSALDNDYDYITIDSSGKLLVFDMYDNPAGLSQDHYKIERFTGFADKNGKDIYEGDQFMWGKSLITVKWVDQSDGRHLCVCDEFDEPMNLRLISQRYEVVGTVHTNSSEKPNSSDD